LGQVVARDPRLAPELRARLQRLESLPGGTPVLEVRHAIRRAIGATPGVVVAPRAIAEASVAVVIPFTWRQGNGAAPERGVLKVLKPGVADRLDDELAIWSSLGSYLDERCGHYGLPALDYREVIDGVSRRLRHEVQLEHEQAHLTQAARLYEGDANVRIPRLLPFCRADVSAMERIDGRKITSAKPADRRRTAEMAVSALIARPFLSNDPLAPFHADPHPGNLHLTPGGQLAIFDWSLVARLSKSKRSDLVGVLLNALTLNDAGVCRTLDAMSSRPPAESELRRLVSQAMRQVRWGKRPGFIWMLELLDRAVAEARLRLSEDLVLFRKAAHTLSGVLSELSTPNCIDGVLLETGLANYLQGGMDTALGSDPPGWLGPGSANARLLDLWCTAPATAARFWLGAWRDVAGFNTTR
jgi:ubiquinone biosynthesis protein